jgi:acyl-CoA synthetase (AMP-forming)/AMP-acid ligase II
LSILALNPVEAVRRVVDEDGTEVPSGNPGELEAKYVKGRVATDRYARRIWFVDSLPAGPNGKLLRGEAIPPFEEA